MASVSVLFFKLLQFRNALNLSTCNFFSGLSLYLVHCCKVMFNLGFLMKDANNTSKQWNEQLQLTKRNRIGFRRLSTTWNWSYKRFMSTFRLKLVQYSHNRSFVAVLWKHCVCHFGLFLYLMFLKVQWLEGPAVFKISYQGKSIAIFLIFSPPFSNRQRSWLGTLSVIINRLVYFCSFFYVNNTFHWNWSNRHIS